MNTHITNIKGDWQEVVDTCRATSGKGSLGHEPSEDFKRRILIAEHSPIRRISVSWVWQGIKSWIATHWSRHKWECFISTQRTDRTGTPRDKLPQDAPVIFEGEANVQALIDTMRKRLCRQTRRRARMPRISRRCCMRFSRRSPTFWFRTAFIAAAARKCRRAVCMKAGPAFDRKS